MRRARPRGAGRDLDMNVVETVITRHLDDLLEFAQLVRAQMDREPQADNG